MQKVLVVILGAGASGKSTLTRNICGEGAEEHSTTFTCFDRKLNADVTEKIKYTLFPNGVAIAGNLKNGSDSIGKMEALNQTVELLFTKRHIVIVDGVRSSAKFVDWLHDHPMERLSTIFVYFDITLEANLARLKGRRQANGKDEGELSEKTYNNVLSFRSRAERVWKHAKQNFKRMPYAFVRINDATTAPQAAKTVWDVIRAVSSIEVHQKSTQVGGTN